MPPGQILTGKFPVVGEQQGRSGADPSTWTLQIDGLVEQVRSWSIQELLAMEQSEQTVDIHCVTGWSRPQMQIRGLPLSRLLDAVRPRADAHFVRFVADSERGHDTSLPLAFARENTWIVHEMDGAPLAPEHGAPLRSVTPGRYFYKSVKWLCRIELLAQDRLGYWERESAYHNEADPLSEQRFDERRISQPEEVQAFREATSLQPWRSGRGLLKARLGGWNPQDRDLRGLQLKFCSLRQAQLQGADLRGANLSLSNLSGADLRNVRFDDADLEGANLSGADLRGAVLCRTALSATRFFRPRNGEPSRVAQVEGADFRGCRGLMEEQRQVLLEAGAILDA